MLVTNFMAFHSISVMVNTEMQLKGSSSWMLDLYSLEANATKFIPPQVIRVNHRGQKLWKASSQDLHINNSYSNGFFTYFTTHRLDSNNILVIKVVLFRCMILPLPLLFVLGFERSLVNMTSFLFS